MAENSNEVPLFGVGILAGVVLSVATLIGLKLTPEDLNSVTMSYADLAAIMLGAVAVIVTVLGVGIAVLALWGYAQFKRSAANAALRFVENQLSAGKLKQDIAETIAAEVIRQMDDGKLRAIMEERVDRQLHLGPSRRAKAADEKIGNEEAEYGD